MSGNGSGIDWDNPPKIDISASYSNALAQSIARVQKDQEDTFDAIAREREEKERRVEERHKEMLSKMDETNSILKDRLDTANVTLDFILSSIGANSQRIERQQLLTNDLFLELCTIMKSKEQNRLKHFLQEHSLEGIGLVLEFVSLSLSGR